LAGFFDGSSFRCRSLRPDRQLPVFFQAALRTSANGLWTVADPSHSRASDRFHHNGFENFNDRASSDGDGCRFVHCNGGLFLLAAGIELGPVVIALLTCLIGAGLGSTMPAAQTYGSNGPPG